jgi:hypothetical protein
MADTLILACLVAIALGYIALLCMDGDGKWRRIPEWLELTLGVLGFFALIASGVIGALIAVGYELFVPSRKA